MESAYIWVFLGALIIMSLLFWMLFPIKEPALAQNPIKGFCPICSHPLRKGERVRSDVLEIGDSEVRTKIKGCPYCLTENAKENRQCPVCRKPLQKNEMIVALSNPKIDKKKLSIRGCTNCYPEGFR